DSVITIQHNNFSIAAGQSTTVYQVNMATGVGDLTVTNNNFNVTTPNNITVGAYYNPQGHYDPSSGVGARSTHTISNNFITGSKGVAASTSNLYCIYEYYGYSKHTIIANNTIRDITWFGSVYGVYNYMTYTPYVLIENNLVYYITNRYTTGYMYGGIYNYNYTAPFGL